MIEIIGGPEKLWTDYILERLVEEGVISSSKDMIYVSCPDLSDDMAHYAYSLESPSGSDLECAVYFSSDREYRRESILYTHKDGAYDQAIIVGDVAKMQPDLVNSLGQAIFAPIRGDLDAAKKGWEKYFNQRDMMKEGIICVEVHAKSAVDALLSSYLQDFKA